MQCCININKTLPSMSLILKYIQKRKIHEETRGGSLFHRGESLFYYSILTPGSLFCAGQYSIWHRHHPDGEDAQQETPAMTGPASAGHGWDRHSFTTDQVCQHQGCHCLAEICIHGMSYKPAPSRNVSSWHWRCFSWNVTDLSHCIDADVLLF